MIFDRLLPTSKSTQKEGKRYITKIYQFQRYQLQDDCNFDRKIYQEMRNIEDSYQADKDLFDLQSTITHKMRSIVIDWLVEVHCQMGYHSDTLYLTVSLLDRFLSRCDIDKSTFQRY